MPAPFTRQTVTERALARVGTTVQQKYRIDRLIGIGGTAAVYAATHRNGHRVAIKFLLDHLLDDSDIYHLFSREAYAANRVGHPGAVPVLDDDEDKDGCVFLIMPLVEGETLRARWERTNKRLPVAEVCVLLADVLDVLECAHTKGVVHRDIKPENLFVTLAAQIRVLDFGIARRTGGDTTLTMTGRFIGTPAFMPPEQAIGNRQAIGPSSDLWAAGATMFSLLSGESVHVAETSGAQLAAAATRHARPMVSVVPDLTPAIAHVVDKALSFEVGARWTSAREMRQALIAALEETTGDKHDVTSARVRAEIVAEFAERASNAVASVRGEDAGLRSGVTREKTPREAISGRNSEDGDARSDGSDRRVREAGVARGNGDMTTLGAGQVRRVSEAADEAAVKPVVHDTGRGGGASDTDKTEHDATDAAVARRRGWGTSAAVWTLVIGLAGVTGAGAMKTCGGLDGTIGGPATAVAASTNTEAQAALEAGLQLWKDASTDAARRKFAEAARKDPGLAVAHLYFAAASEWRDPDVRTHFTDARALRVRLSRPQAALLDALEPLMQQPPDEATTTRKLEALTANFPKDEIGWIVRAAHDLRVKDTTRLLSTAEHLQGALALWFHGRASDLRNDVEGARKSLQSCAAESPQSGIDCLSWLAKIESNEGACEDSARAAKRLIAIDHASPDGYRFLARAEYGRSHRTSSVRAILEGAWARMPESMRELESRRDEFELALLDGEFDRAYEHLDAWGKAALSSVDAQKRAVVFTSRIDLDLELGRTDAALRAANTFIDASQTWLPEETWDIPNERTRALYLTGQIDREQFRQQQVRDEEGLIARGGLFASPSIRWFNLHVHAIKDAEDARFALAHQPSDDPVVSPSFRSIVVNAEVGKMFLLAGQSDKAVESLGRAAKSCFYLRAPYNVRAHALYGDALSQIGRTREACDQYSFVLQRWGREPRSRTAQAVRESSRRLGCPDIGGSAVTPVVKE